MSHYSPVPYDGGLSLLEPGDLEKTFKWQLSPYVLRLDMEDGFVMGVGYGWTLQSEGLDRIFCLAVDS